MKILTRRRQQQQKPAFLIDPREPKEGYSPHYASKLNLLQHFKESGENSTGNSEFAYQNLGFRRHNDETPTRDNSRYRSNNRSKHSDFTYHNPMFGRYNDETPTRNISRHRSDGEESEHSNSSAEASDLNATYTSERLEQGFHVRRRNRQENSDRGSYFKHRQEKDVSDHYDTSGELKKRHITQEEYTKFQPQFTKCEKDGYNKESQHQPIRLRYTPDNSTEEFESQYLRSVSKRLAQNKIIIPAKKSENQLKPKKLRITYTTTEIYEEQSGTESSDSQNPEQFTTTESDTENNLKQFMVKPKKKKLTMHRPLIRTRKSQYLEKQQHQPAAMKLYNSLIGRKRQPPRLYGELDHNVPIQETHKVPTEDIWMEKSTSLSLSGRRLQRQNHSQSSSVNASDLSVTKASEQLGGDTSSLYYYSSGSSLPEVDTSDGSKGSRENKTRNKKVNKFNSHFSHQMPLPTTDDEEEDEYDIPRSRDNKCDDSHRRAKSYSTLESRVKAQRRFLIESQKSDSKSKDRHRKKSISKKIRSISMMCVK